MLLSPCSMLYAPLPFDTHDAVLPRRVTPARRAVPCCAMRRCRYANLLRATRLRAARSCARADRCPLMFSSLRCCCRLPAAEDRWFDAAAARFITSDAFAHVDASSAFRCLPRAMPALRCHASAFFRRRYFVMLRYAACRHARGVSIPLRCRHALPCCPGAAACPRFRCPLYVAVRS